MRKKNTCCYLYMMNDLNVLHQYKFLGYWYQYYKPLQYVEYVYALLQIVVP
jgi:hypothetical protein